MKKNWLLVLIVLFAQTTSRGRMVIGYYPSWGYATYPYYKIDYTQLTHICHAFIYPQNDGSITKDSWFIVPEFIPAAHAHNVNVLVSVGGWGFDAQFTALASHAASRNRFVNQLKDFILANGYDGADIDWEYPGSADKANCTALFTELRYAFDLAGIKYLSAAVSSRECNGLNYEVLNDKLDWFGIMTYDYHGAWTSHSGHVAPLYSYSRDYDGSVDESYRYYIKNLPANKICLGMPFYGYDFTTAELWSKNTSSTTPSVDYKDIQSKRNSGFQYNWDDICKVPYLTHPSSTHVICYDDTLSIRLKGEYITRKSVAGVIIWAIGFDYDSKTNRQPLLEIVGGLLKNSEPTHLSALLADTYSNPYSSGTVIQFQLSMQTRVIIKIFTVLGQEVATIHDKVISQGSYEVNFDGDGLPGGDYFYQLQAGEYHETGKMVLIK